MLLDPEKYAPKRQYHADVDKSRRTIDIPEELDLGEVYRRHRPLDAPITAPPEETHDPRA